MREFDVSVFRAIHRGWHSPALDPIFAFFSYAGLGVAPAILAVILLSMPRTRATGSVLAVALLFGALGIANLIKGEIGRERPSNLAFAIPQESHLLGSFPSGHTTTGFVVAFSLLFMRPGTRYDRLWIGLGFVYAVMVGLSRIYRGVHWPSDVLGGLCLGALSAALAAIVVRRRPRGREGSGEAPASAS